MPIQQCQRTEGIYKSLHESAGFAYLNVDADVTDRWPVQGASAPRVLRSRSSRTSRTRGFWTTCRNGSKWTSRSCRRKSISLLTVSKWTHVRRSVPTSVTSAGDWRADVEEASSLCECRRGLWRKPRPVCDAACLWGPCFQFPTVMLHSFWLICKPSGPIRKRVPCIPKGSRTQQAKKKTEPGSRGKGHENVGGRVMYRLAWCQVATVYGPVCRQWNIIT